MARKTQERENLLRDATALLPRVQLRIASGDVFAGFRSGDALSLYFGEAPVYHFNGRGQLRRAFVDDRLVKAEFGELVAWQRRHVNQSTEMLRHELTAEETQQFRRTLDEHLDRLRGALEGGQYTVVGQVPADGDAMARLADWLASPREFAIATSPGVGA